MYSETIICNIALANIGQTTQIVDLATEESKAAKMCRMFYPLARDNALSDYPWTFAREVVELAILSNEDEETDYNFIYAFPDDCLEPRSIVVPNVPIGLYYQFYPAFFFAGLNGNTETSVPEYLRPSFEKGVSNDKKSRTIITNYFIHVELKKLICGPVHLLKLLLGVWLLTWLHHWRKV